MGILDYTDCYVRNLKFFSDDRYVGSPERFAKYEATYIIRVDGEISE
jgi:hypothetical protein